MTRRLEQFEEKPLPVLCLPLCKNKEIEADLERRRKALKWLVPVLVFLAAFFATAGARAQTCTFNVTNVNFGNVDTLAGAAVDTTATVTITCSALLSAILPVRVCLNLNRGSGGATSTTRHMRNAANAPLNYGLFQDAARQIPWGSIEEPALGNPVSLVFNNITLGAPQTQTATIYARVLANQQSAATGLYTSDFRAAEVSFNYVAALLLPPNCSNVTQNPTRPIFAVRATVVPNCSVTAQNINFGNHGVLDTNIDATGDLGVTCTPGAPYTIALSNGLTGTSPTQRRMALGAQAVLYGLYLDAARSLPWGSSAGQLLSSTGTGALQNVPVYGRVLPQLTPSPGTYSDTVVVTVAY